MNLIWTETVFMRQMQDTKKDKRSPTLPTNLLSSFGWAYRYLRCQQCPGAGESGKQISLGAWLDASTLSVPHSFG